MNNKIEKSEEKKNIEGKEDLMSASNESNNNTNYNTNVDIDKENKENLLVSAVIALFLAVAIRTFFYEPFHIPSGSMKPGLVEGDYILVRKFSYGYSKYSFPFSIAPIKNRIFDISKPKRGDVIVFKLPTNPKINYIKRLVGLPNDKVVIKNNVLYINDVEVSRKYVGEYFETSLNTNVLEYEENITENKKIRVLQLKQIYPDNGNNDGEFIVPDGYYFFMGDNRDNSLDSRFPETGVVPYRNIVGKADIIFFSKKGFILNIFKWRFNRILKVIK